MNDPFVYFGGLGFLPEDLHKGLDEFERRGFDLTIAERAMASDPDLASYHLGFLADAESYPENADHSLRALLDVGRAS